MRGLTLGWSSLLMRGEWAARALFVTETGKMRSVGSIVGKGGLRHAMTEGLYLGFDLHCHPRVVQALVSCPLCLNSAVTRGMVVTR
jgi:hypothetical protein